MSTAPRILAENRNPQDQSVEEWQADLATAQDQQLTRSPERPPLRQPQAPGEANGLTGLFAFTEHRTTKRSRAIFEFEHVETGTPGHLFFNVRLVGTRSGKSFPARRRGQFTTSPRDKFQKFWMQIVGVKPRSWSRVHLEMNKLGKTQYQGKAIFKNGYWKLIELQTPDGRHYIDPYEIT